ncbi:tRNA methyl transferase [Umbelopsis sp. PMI_123]|nr:tRNA methyl transferase [Umbelopsis sp. PMI_123]
MLVHRNAATSIACRFFNSLYRLHAIKQSIPGKQHSHTLPSTPKRSPSPGDSVILAMSGGVDSSVSAILLKEQGYNVQGVYMRNWDTSDERGVCTSEEDYRDVQSVCNSLDIPCRRLDFTKEYWNQVFQKTLDDYERGVTPNPDVMCNREIKFGALLERCMSSSPPIANSETWFATGHYARIDRSSGTTRLLRGLDSTKDQSYYLSAVDEQAFSRVMFPLGHLPKSRVKELAMYHGLDRIVKKPESMGICFVGKRAKFADFLAQYIHALPGPAVDLDGNSIGEHRGLFGYTIGQGAHIHYGTDRWFVAGKDINENKLICVPGTDHPSLFANRLTARDWIWINGEPPELGQLNGSIELDGQVRYRQSPLKCTVTKTDDNNYAVDFHTPIRGIAAGQNVVLWNGDWCLGGGIINMIDNPIL